MKTIETPQHLDLFQRGLDAFGQSPLTFENSEENKKALTSFASGMPSNFIMDGELITDITIRGTFYVNDGANDRVLIGYGKDLF